jgi:hypothetical protein
MLNSFKQNNSTITTNNALITGNNNVVVGNRNTIIGSNNRIRGDYNKATGINNNAIGNFNSIIGDNHGMATFKFNGTINNKGFMGNKIFSSVSNEETSMVLKGNANVISNNDSCIIMTGSSSGKDVSIDDVLRGIKLPMLKGPVGITKPSKTKSKYIAQTRISRTPDKEDFSLREYKNNIHGLSYQQAPEELKVFFIGRNHHYHIKNGVGVHQCKIGLDHVYTFESMMDKTDDDVYNVHFRKRVFTVRYNTVMFADQEVCKLEEDYFYVNGNKVYDHHSVLVLDADKPPAKIE